MLGAVCAVVCRPRKRVDHNGNTNGSLDSPDAVEILMVRRAPPASMPGYWTPITGKLNKGESPRAAAIRECQEETALAVAPIKEVWGCPTSTNKYWLTWWLCLLEDAAPPQRVHLKQDEVDAHRWLTAQQIVAGTTTATPLFDDTRQFFQSFATLLPLGVSTQSEAV